ncbi:hypothetical protein C4Z12_007275, partial [Klebsiella pneumoniae subsp. pneumoniae]
GTVCVVGKMRDLILQLSKSSIYSTKPSVKDSLSGYFPFPYYTSKKNSTSIRMDSWSLNTV